MLYVDSARIGTSKVTDKLLGGRRVPERINRQNIQQMLCLRLQASAGKLLGVFLRLFGENKAEFHQASFLLQAETGVAIPARIDSLMPGMETK